MKTMRFIVLFNLMVLSGFTLMDASSVMAVAATDTIQKDSVSNKQLYLITKINGTEYIGEILSDDGREVLINTEGLGRIYIPKSEIKSITKIEDKKSVVRGEYYDAGPFTTRYAFTTNALPLKKGMNYAMINLYGPEVHFALSDRFSLGIMTSWLASPYVLVSKYSFKTTDKNRNWSVGAMLGTSGYLNNLRGFGGLPFVSLTYGSTKKNMTFSGGFLYLNSGSMVDVPGVYDGSSVVPKELSPALSGPIFSVAAITKVGAKASFVFDSMFGFFSGYSTNSSYDYNYNYYQFQVTQTKDNSFVLCLMPGMRFQTSDYKAFQISLAGVSIIPMNNKSNGGRKIVTFPMPMCSWFYRF